MWPGFDQSVGERPFYVRDHHAARYQFNDQERAHITVEMLDNVQGGNQGVMVVRDGTLRGGDSFFYAYGAYTGANGKWKGEVTNHEHSPTYGERPSGSARW